MTTRKHFKRRVRARAARTGQPYAAALRDIRREQQESRMPAASARAEDVLASCSFCNKPSHQVARLVAGPGVFICNECVELSATLVADAARTSPEESTVRRQQYAERPTGDILASLPALVRSAARVEAELAGLVERLRERGTDWPTIAGAMAMGVEEARQRFETTAGA